MKPSAAISALVHELAAEHIVRPALTTCEMVKLEAIVKSAAAAAAAVCAPAAKLRACWTAIAAAVTVEFELSEGLALIRSDKLDTAVKTEVFAVWLCVDARLARDAVATFACWAGDKSGPKAPPPPPPPPPHAVKVIATVIAKYATKLVRVLINFVLS